jgi:EAL domain-containing protein (putative c-di-GMP-specific phosphodiesterase class I)
VVAEGIETRDQFELLREQACDVGQGYLLGKPVAPGQAFSFCAPAAFDEPATDIDPGRFAAGLRRTASG